MNPEKLTKAEIIEHIAEKVTDKNQISKKVIHEILDSFIEEIKTALLDDRVVELRGFGTFEIRTRKGREKARNPRTGETLPVSNHGVPVFRPGKELKSEAWALRS